jgi:6-phospho-3-hexuloisomerase
MRLNHRIVLNEVDKTLETSNFDELEIFIHKILNANRIVLFGAGRVGLMVKTFAMRLNHLGLESYFLGEINLPATGLGDLLIIGSGSGNTKSVVTIAQIAQSKGLEVVSVTANTHSVIASLSSSLIHINCQNKESNPTPMSSVQPMTTLFEQSLLIFLDSLVLELMIRLKEDNESMSRRHNVIE